MQRLDLVEPALHATDELVGRRPDETGGIGDQLLVALQQTDGVLAGDRLDAAQVGPDGRLADDLDETDVAAARDVGATAQLDRVADLEHPDDVAVLVAEEGDRAERRRFVLRRLERPSRRVGQRLAVGEPFDLARSRASVTAS